MEVLAEMAVPVYQAEADLLRVLGHPARIRVLELLSEREHAAGELLERIPIEAGSLSQQLAVLRRAGLVSQRRGAGGVVYALVVDEVRDVLLAARTVLGVLPATDPLPPDLRSATPAGGVAAAGVTASVVARRSLAG